MTTDATETSAQGARLRLLLRRMHPGMTREHLESCLGAFLPSIAHIDFVPGRQPSTFSGKPPRHSWAAVSFVSEAALRAFATAGSCPLTTAGAPEHCVLAYAPVQQPPAPGDRAERLRALAGTMHDDPLFKTFCADMERVAARQCAPLPEFVVSTAESQAAAKDVETPMLAHFASAKVVLAPVVAAVTYCDDEVPLPVAAVAKKKKKKSKAKTPSDVPQPAPAPAAQTARHPQPAQQQKGPQPSATPAQQPKAQPPAAAPTPQSKAQPQAAASTQQSKTLQSAAVPAPQPKVQPQIVTPAQPMKTQQQNAVPPQQSYLQQQPGVSAPPPNAQSQPGSSAQLPWIQPEAYSSSYQNFMQNFQAEFSKFKADFEARTAAIVQSLSPQQQQPQAMPAVHSAPASQAQSQAMPQRPAQTAPAPQSAVPDAPFPPVRSVSVPKVTILKRGTNPPVSNINAPSNTPSAQPVAPPKPVLPIAPLAQQTPSPTNSSTASAPAHTNPVMQSSPLFYPLASNAPTTFSFSNSPLLSTTRQVPSANVAPIFSNAGNSSSNVTSTQPHDPVPFNDPEYQEYGRLCALYLAARSALKQTYGALLTEDFFIQLGSSNWRVSCNALRSIEPQMNAVTNAVNEAMVGHQSCMSGSCLGATPATQGVPFAANTHDCSISTPSDAAAAPAATKDARVNQSVESITSRAAAMTSSTKAAHEAKAGHQSCMSGTCLGATTETQGVPFAANTHDRSISTPSDAAAAPAAAKDARVNQSVSSITSRAAAMTLQVSGAGNIAPDASTQPAKAAAGAQPAAAVAAPAQTVKQTQASTPKVSSSAAPTTKSAEVAKNKTPAASAPHNTKPGGETKASASNASDRYVRPADQKPASAAPNGKSVSVPAAPRAGAATNSGPKAVVYSTSTKKVVRQPLAAVELAQAGQNLSVGAPATAAPAPPAAKSSKDAPSNSMAVGQPSAAAVAKQASVAAAAQPKARPAAPNPHAAAQPGAPKAPKAAKPQPQKAAAQPQSAVLPPKQA